MKEMINRFNDLVDETDGDSGMETAQVIIILLVVVVLILPVLYAIATKLQEKGDLVNDELDTYQRP